MVMGRKRKKKPLPPRCKRMTRSARLQSAASWLKQYDGKNVLRGYCKHFAVDWRCAAIELRQLGVRLDPQYLQQREITERETARARERRRAARETAASPDYYSCYDSLLEAYQAEDYPALYAMELERDGQEPTANK
jgi:hypothetical protein